MDDGGAIAARASMRSRGRRTQGNYDGKTCERGNKDRTEEGSGAERREEQKANGEGRVALILADRNFRWSDGGEVKGHRMATNTHIL